MGNRWWQYWSTVKHEEKKLESQAGCLGAQKAACLCSILKIIPAQCIQTDMGLICPSNTVFSFSFFSLFYFKTNKPTKNQTKQNTNHTVQWKSWPGTGNQAIGYSFLKLSSCWGLSVKLFYLKDKSCCCHSFFLNFLPGEHVPRFCSA